jgi:hypothetical protein
MLQGQGQQTGRALHAKLAPQVYFSPRRSSAPDTDGGRAAEAAAAGAGAVAGEGTRHREWSGHCLSFVESILSVFLGTQALLCLPMHRLFLFSRIVCRAGRSLGG